MRSRTNYCLDTKEKNSEALGEVNLNEPLIVTKGSESIDEEDTFLVDERSLDDTYMVGIIDPKTETKQRLKPKFSAQMTI